MTNVVFVKPNPARPETKILKHPASGALVDAAGNVPETGRPWLYDGFTCRMLVSGAIMLADDPIFAKPAAADVAPAPADVAASEPPAPISPAAPPAPAAAPAAVPASAADPAK